MQSAVLAEAGARAPAERGAPRTVAVAVLGADALLAAQPATPVQIAHACRQAGYDTAIPACWGDELVAAETLKQLETRGARPAIFCACPLVTGRLLAKGPHLAPFMVATVSPPVATARYVRRLFEGSEVRITYVGSCPGAQDPAIDERAEPHAFLDALAARGIEASRQPLVFDSVIPPDRRRHFSVTGGLPAPECLAALEPPRAGVEITVDDFSSELAQHLIAGDCALLDVAPRLGCVCSGWRDGAALPGARSALAALDPPRSTHHSVVDLSLGVDVSAPLPVASSPVASLPAPSPARAQQQQQQPPPGTDATAPAPRADSRHAPGAGAAGDAPAAPAPGTAPRSTPPPVSPAAALAQRRKSTSSGFFRAATTAVPRTRSGEGPALPRAYVARRRSPAGEVRAVRSRADESLGPAAGGGRGTVRGGGGEPSAIPTPPEVPVLAAPAEPVAAGTRTTEPARRLHTPHSVGTYTVPPAPPPAWRTPAAAVIAALVLLTLIAAIVAAIVL